MIEHALYSACASMLAVGTRHTKVGSMRPCRRKKIEIYRADDPESNNKIAIELSWKIRQSTQECKKESWRNCRDEQPCTGREEGHGGQ
jgi:hypothetical protein